MSHRPVIDCDLARPQATIFKIVVICERLYERVIEA